MTSAGAAMIYLSGLEGEKKESTSQVLVVPIYPTACLLFTTLFTRTVYSNNQQFEKYLDNVPD